MLQARARGARAGRVGKGARGGIAPVPPTVSVILSMVSLQFGASVAKRLFDQAGPVGTVSMRVGFAALVLLLWWRPRVREYGRGDLVTIALFGLVSSAMNLALYEALARLPLGVAVTIEFLGPLGVALAGSRRVRDVFWALLAAGGILLLSPLGENAATGRLDSVGVAFALLAATCWAGYILLASRVGRIATGGNEIALAMGVGALVLVPFGVASAGAALRNPGLLLMGFAVALLSTALPYTLEMEALRRLPTRVFGVLMSLDPVIAALIGFVILREAIAPRALAAITLITIAAVGAAQTRARTAPPLDAT